MARGKSKTEGNISQLTLFNEELPAEAVQEEAPPEKQGRKRKSDKIPPPAEAIQEVQQEAALPKKRGRKRKSDEPPPLSEAPGTEEKLPEPAASLEEPAAPQPADPVLTQKKETELQEKHRQNQEARLAALRKARGQK